MCDTLFYLCGILENVLIHLVPSHPDAMQASGSFWELPYMQHVQLAVGNLREVLFLQRFFDGKEADYKSAHP